MNDLAVDPAIRNLWHGSAILSICVMTVSGNSLVSEDRFAQEVHALEDELKTAGKQVLQDARVLQMRVTFRAMPDMDPTRYRPSSEALLRRFTETGFFRINPLVDMNNLLSARLKVPLGIYDLGRLPKSAWVYRIGLEGETYQTFSGQSKNAAGKLVMSDDDGVFGSPVADSGRASISAETTGFAVVAYLPFDTSAHDAEALAKQIEAECGRHFAVRESRILIVKNW